MQKQIIEEGTEVLSESTSSYIFYIEKKRSNHNMSIKELCDKAGIAEQTYYRYKRLDVQVNEEAAIRFAIAMDMDLNDALSFLKHGDILLDPHNKTERLLMRAIEHHEKNFDSINEQLEKYSCKPFFKPKRDMFSDY